MRQELTNMHAFVNDFWKLIKKYPDVPSKAKDSFWIQLTDDATELCENYKTYPVTAKIVCCWLDHLEGKD